MKYLIVYSLIFILGGSLGYLIELVFRRIVHKKWINPGFLTGPCLPLYGVGTVCLFFISSFDYSFIPSPAWRAVFVISLITVAMTLVEYITGLIFIKGMHVKLWDYSDRLGNVQGIICPLFTFFWGVIGAIYYLFLNKFFVNAAVWLGENPWFSFGVGLYFGVFIVDICYSFKVVAKVRKWAKDKQIVVKYEAFKLSAAKKAQEFKEKFNFFFGLHGKRDLNKDLDAYAADEKNIPELKNS